MGRMKDLLIAKADEIALKKYGMYYYLLTVEQQSEVWKLAEQAGQEYLASQIDAENDRRKYNDIQPTGYCPYSAVQHKCGLVKPPAKVCHACLLEMKEGGKENV